MASTGNAPVGGSAPAVRSSLEVAIWFHDRADSANRKLDTVTLQQLLYLSQVEFAQSNNGRKLMPATFLATATGPLEPTIYHVFERGRPNVSAVFPRYEISDFLMDVWDKYATLPPADLTRIVTEDLHYRHAFDQGRNHEISVTALRVIEPEQPGKSREPEKQPPAAPIDENFVGISPSGKLATKWQPGRAPGSPPDDGKPRS